MIYGGKNVGSTGDGLRSLLSKVTSGFMSLRGSPSELWKAYLLKFLDSYSYFSFSIIFTLFLSADFGFSDVEAGEKLPPFSQSLCKHHGTVLMTKFAPCRVRIRNVIWGLGRIHYYLWSCCWVYRRQSRCCAEPSNRFLAISPL